MGGQFEMITIGKDCWGFHLKEGTDTELGNLRSLKDQTNREILNFTIDCSLLINLIS